MKKKKKIIVGLLLVVVIALAMLFVKKQSDSSQKAKVENGSKAYTFVVVNKDGKEKVTKGKTDAKYLKNLMDLKLYLIDINSWLLGHYFVFHIDMQIFLK